MTLPSDAAAGVSYLDLFCGAGGASCGAHQAGADLIAGADVNEAALRTHAHNLPGAHLSRDLSVATPAALPDRDVDWLHGSPPCQGFSKATGDRKDPTDERNQLVWAFVEWAAALSPKVVTMENVAGMAFIEDGWMATLEQRFREAGYEAHWRTLNAADYGVPQTRERIFVLALRDDIERPDRWFPAPTHAKTATSTLTGESLAAWRTVEDALGDLATPTPPEAATDGGVTQALPNHDVDPATERPLGGAAPHPAVTVTSRAQLQARYVGSQLPMNARDVRSMTVREAARLQSFPDWFAFCGTKREAMQQVGNAVPPRLQRHLAAHVGTILSEP